jgi:hypothetical protein
LGGIKKNATFSPLHGAGILFWTPQNPLSGEANMRFSSNPVDWMKLSDQISETSSQTGDKQQKVTEAVTKDMLQGIKLLTQTIYEKYKDGDVEQHYSSEERNIAYHKVAIVWTCARTLIMAAYTMMSASRMRKTIDKDLDMAMDCATKDFAAFGKRVFNDE